MLGHTLLALALLAAASKDQSRTWKDMYGWHKVLRDGREVGKHCNPCREEAKSDYKPPAVAVWHFMGGACSPNGIDGKSKPPKSCTEGKK